MEWKTFKKGSLFYIRIKGLLNPDSFGWMEGARMINQENHETLLAIHLTDQSALRGFLEQLWNLNFTVLSVERIDEQG